MQLYLEAPVHSWFLVLPALYYTKYCIPNAVDSGDLGGPFDRHTSATGKRGFDSAEIIFDSTSWFDVTDPSELKDGIMHRSTRRSEAYHRRQYLGWIRRRISRLDPKAGRAISDVVTLHALGELESRCEAQQCANV